jgi:uncharacterized surface protein with fasciclin (FAS1) repeats
MKTVLKKLAATLGVIGFGVALASLHGVFALPSVAQSNFTPGPANDPSQPGAPPTDRDTGVTPIQGNPPTGENVPGTASSANRPVAPSQPLSGANTNGQTIDAIVRTSPSFELFNALLRVADPTGAIATRLSKNEDYTVFAPTDQALAQIPPATFRALVQPENRDLLVRILENHIVEGKVSSADLVSRQVESSGGNPITAQGGQGAIIIGNARVVGPDIVAENGIVHAVDNLILPSDIQAQLGGLGAQPSVPGQTVR